MIYIVALIIFVLGYVISKVFLEHVKPLASVAEVLALVIGALCALVYLGVLGI